MCLCSRGRERRAGVCVFACKRRGVCGVCVCVLEREREGCVCVCVREGGRERERERTKEDCECVNVVHLCFCERQKSVCVLK